MNMRSVRLVCARCGDRIGVYEPFWLRRPDGALMNTAFLPLRASGSDGADGSLFHLGCLAPDVLPDAEAAD